MEQPDCGDYDRRAVIAWLRSTAGQNWASRRNSTLFRHDYKSGVFADVLPDGSTGSEASWPESLGSWDLGHE